MQDLVSGDEIISDSYDMKIVDDTVYEVNCRKVTKGAENIGPSCALVTTLTPPPGTWLKYHFPHRYWCQPISRGTGGGERRYL